MDKEDKQIIDRAIKEEWRIGDRTRLKRLLEKNLEQYRDNVELENKIADLKANCDLAIEGRDITIKELTVENADLKKEIEKHKWNDIFLEDCAGYDKKIAEEYTTLQERIEKLEQENERLRGDLELWESGGCRATNLFECGVVKELKERYDKVDIIGYDTLKNLTKAENIIRELLFHLTNDTFYVTFETREQSVERARQFLQRR